MSCFILETWCVCVWAFVIKEVFVYLFFNNRLCLSPAFGSGPAFGASATGGSAFGFSANKPSGGSLSAGVCHSTLLSLSLFLTPSLCFINIITTSYLWYPYTVDQSHTPPTFWSRVSFLWTQLMNKIPHLPWMWVWIEITCIYLCCCVFSGFGSSSTSGFNFSNPGINASAGLTFGVSTTPSAGFGTGVLQLKKPPAGNKRGKR